MLSHITGGYKTKADVKDGHLTLSFPDAQTPGIWHLDLTKAPTACAFELVEEKGGQAYKLVYKDGDKTAKTVATYTSRPRAVRAVMQTSKALSKRQRNLSAQTSSAQGQNGQAPVIVQTKGGFPWGKILLLIIAIWIGYSFIASRFFAPAPIAQTQQQPAQNDEAAQSDQVQTQTQEPRGGEPVPADLLLEQMQQNRN